MSNYWFKPKTKGYGAAPTDWRGWAWIGVFAAVDLGSMYIMLLRPLFAGSAPTLIQFVLWLGFIAVVTVIFIYVCKIKTEGEWRWRWSTKDTSE